MFQQLYINFIFFTKVLAFLVKICASFRGLHHYNPPPGALPLNPTDSTDNYAVTDLIFTSQGPFTKVLAGE